MATSYYPPDVEILQKFSTTSPTVNLATLQAVIVGPSFKKLKDFDDAESTRLRLGSYSRGSMFKHAFPELPSGAIIDKDSLELIVVNYEGENLIKKTDVKVESETGAITSTYTQEGVRYAVFQDNNIDFNAKGVEAGPEAADNDGHFISFEVETGETDQFGNPVTETEYFEIQEIRDSHTVVIDDPDMELAPKSDIAYRAGNFGWMLDPDTNEIIMTERIDHSGTVYISGRARRTDYCDQLVQASSLEELENIFGAGEVTPENPLAYGMRIALSYIATGSIVGVMVESDDANGYQKAFELLENYEVYCVVPLTNNPIVHQMAKEHVLAMSAITEKRERVTMINGARILRQVKSGLTGRKDAVTGIYDMATGTIENSGEGLDEDVVCSHSSFAAEAANVDAEQSFAVDGATRGYVYYDGDAEKCEIKYFTSDAPETAKNLTLNANGYAFIPEMTGKTITSIRFTATAEDEGKVCHAYVFKTVNAPVKNQVAYGYAMIGDGSITAEGSTITPSGKRCIKIRCFNADGSVTGEQALDVATLPNSLKVKVTTSNSTETITAAGTYTYTSDITSIAFENIAAATNIGNNAIEILMANNGGTYKLDTFKDSLATFGSDQVRPGDEIVLVDKTEEDAETDSGFKENRYVVSKVLDEDSLLINGTFTESLGSEHYYRVETAVITNKRDLAEAYASVSAAFNERRVVNVFAPAVGVLDKDGNEIVVPGYYVCCALAGATQSYPPQRGFTNMSLSGFTRVLYTNTYFSFSQLNTIAATGTLIIHQENLAAPISVRHQLTTNMDTVKTKEFSVTKDVDYMAKMARINFRPYLGRYEITEDLLDALYEKGGVLIDRWLRDGNCLPGTAVDKFQVDPKQEDLVYACFNIKVPVPLNYIRLIFAI